jgi:Lon protease-like protein
MEVGSPAVPDLVGCTATIAEWDIPHLGLFHLRARGGQAFRIIDSSAQSDGLIRARVELLDDVPGNVAADAMSLCRQVLEQIIPKLGADNFFPPLEYDNPRWVSYRLAEVLPLAMEDKQALLEARDDGERIGRLRAFLRKVG